MEIRIVREKDIDIAVVHSDQLIITDTNSALDFIADIDYNHGCSRIVINKQAIVEEFFELKSGIAGEILQKFINYSKKIAIVGDFSVYTSKALRDFIFESNNGKDIFFVEDEQTAITKLSS